MPALTAGEVIKRIKANLGVAWNETTYRDTFKFGGPDTEVTGIATTAFASFDVVQRAAKAGLNMIIPHEVTYWNDRDDTTVVADDALYKAKVAFMKQHNMVVFRDHDHMHAQRPDFLFVGSARSLGLESKYETAPQSRRFVIPETTLGELAADFNKRVEGRAIRVVGDPKARVKRIQLSVGYGGGAVTNPDIDVIVSGEQPEADGNLDGPAYVVDAMSLGMTKGWIMLGHAISEEQGMLEMAQWLKTFISEIPVQLIKAGEPFWSPK